MSEFRRGFFAGGALLAAAICGLLDASPAFAQGAGPAGRATIVIFRSEPVPVAAPVPVVVNAESSGELANGTFIVAIVRPGRTFLRAGDRILSSLTLQAAANQNYFVQIQAIPGLAPVRTQMRLVSEAAARGPLAASRFVGRGAAAEAAVKRILGAAPPTAAAPAPPRVSRPSAAAKPERAVRPPPAAAAPTPPPPRPRAPARPRAPRPETAAPVSAPGESGSEIALSVRGGAFKMANGNQLVGGLPSTYDTTSSPAAGLEAEWRSRSGLAIGGEIFYYKNELTANGTTLVGEQTVIAAMLNGKYYFRATDWLYPFAGLGVGLAGAAYSGALIGKASGTAYQGMVGTEFRFGMVGLHLQYKVLASTTDDGAGEKVKVGGKGLLAGISLIF